MKNYITHLAILLVGLVLTNTAFADVKIKLRQTAGGQTYESTTYIKGKRQRAEQNMGGMQTINITQCDLKRSVQIMPQAQTYLINLWEQAPSVAPSITTTTSKQPSTTEKGGVITMTFTTKDTGERKQMFGYTARHLIMTMESESSPDACSPVKHKTQTDGWYIDAAFALDCEMERYKNYTPSSAKPDCRDRYETRQIGTAKRGYPLYEKMTMFDQSGKETSSFTNEVVELSTTTLDAALFDVPAGYREAKNSTELYASMSSQSSTSSSSMSGGDSNDSESGLSASVKNMAAKPQNAAPENNPIAAKKAGVVRVGLAGVKTGGVGEGVNAQELSAAVQNTLAEYLKTPNIEVVSLEAKLPSAIDAEAKSKECDFVVYAQVSHKKGGGGMFGKTLGKLSETVAGRAYGSSDTIGKATQITIMTAAAASGNVKAKDQITLDIKLVAPGSQSPVAAKQFQAKAKADGEDIITQIVEQAAQMIVDASAKK